ncbi:MAG: DUF6502 family protein [Steroidobacteraceae bacterium]
MKRILSAPPRIDPAREARRHRANRILSAWHTDPDYSDDNGTPRELSVRSRDRKALSFWALVQRYAPGVWPRLILQELIRVGAVQELPNQRLKVRMHSFGAAGLQVEAIEELGRRARDLLTTLVHNIQHPEDARVCETALTLDADPKWLPVLRNTLTRRTKVLLAGVDEDLNSPRTTREKKSEPSVRIGLTVFTFEGAAMEGSKRAAKKAKTKRAR